MVFGLLEASNFLYHSLWFSLKSISTLRSPMRAGHEVLFFARVFPAVRVRAIVQTGMSLGISRLLGAFDHGMDRASARRDRPELRN